MRKTLVLFLFVSLCAACFAKPITRAEARLAAAAIVDAGEEWQTVSLAPALGVGEMDEIRPYYVFSRGKGKGFVIASGDDRVTPVLGYTEQGDFDYDNLPEPLKVMLDAWAERIQAVQKTAETVVDDGLTVEQRAIRKVRRAQATDVAPLIQTHWHQSSPYNDLCPVMDNGQHALTGCVATAGAQVIYYFRKDNPTETLYDTPTYGYGTPVTVSIPKGTPIEYDKMLRSGKGSAAQDYAVALLMYVTGTSTWLTYGSSTSGQVYKLGETLNGQFNISNECLYKGSYSQSSWEKRILDNLNSKRPLVYSGVHPDNGGHAVVLDGYKASGNLFHFNFGWGGQGDGYYTVDDETGMNGFSSQQSMLSMPTPKNPKISASMTVGSMYQQADCPIEITVKNNGTLDYSGVYLYCTTGSTMPSTATFSDKTTVVESGKLVVITATYKPSGSKPVTIYLCDANRNVLDKQTVEVQPTVAYIHLNKISVDASAETESLDGFSFGKVNNTTVNVTMNLTNGEGGTFSQPTIRCTVEKYDLGNKAWSVAYQKNIQNETFNVGETKDLVFTFDNVGVGGYYRAYLYKKVRTSQQTDAVYDTPDSIVCFTVGQPDMAIAVDGRQATVTGKWNRGVFAGLSMDEHITYYDFSAVAGLNEKPEVPNPNALIFTNDDVDGVNILKGNVCDNLVLNTGYEFCTLVPFTANKARLQLTDAKPGEFRSVFVPFAATAPSGMLVRHITGLTSTSLSCEPMRDIPAMTPVLYMTDRESLTAIEAENVTIAIDTLFTSDILVGTTTNMTTDGKQYLFGMNASGIPSYLKTDAGAVMPAFSTAVYGTSKSGHRALVVISVDRALMDLATTLAAAWDLAEDESFMAAHLKADVEAFLAAIAEAEAFFVADAATVKDEVDTVKNSLLAAIKAFEESVNGIDDITAECGMTKSAHFYNINGQKVAEYYRGIVIKNGKKLIVR